MGGVLVEARLFISWSDETVRQMRKWLREKYPMFINPGMREGGCP